MKSKSPSFLTPTAPRSVGCVTDINGWDGHGGDHDVVGNRHDAGDAVVGVDVEGGEGSVGQVVAQQVCHGQVGADEELGAGAAVQVALEQQVVAGRVMGEARDAELGVDVEGGEAAVARSSPTGLP